MNIYSVTDIPHCTSEESTKSSLPVTPVNHHTTLSRWGLEEKVTKKKDSCLVSIDSFHLRTPGPYNTRSIPTNTCLVAAAPGTKV